MRDKDGRRDCELSFFVLGEKPDGSEEVGRVFAHRQQEDLEKLPD